MPPRLDPTWPSFNFFYNINIVNNTNVCFNEFLFWIVILLIALAQISSYSIIEASLGKFVDENKTQLLKDKGLPIEGCAAVAGRTDKGVTALQQVCSFCKPFPYSYTAFAISKPYKRIACYILNMKEDKTGAPKSLV
jgi:hypothetical protein